jgi:hypothetical protein
LLQTIVTSSSIKPTNLCHFANPHVSHFLPTCLQL